MEILHKKKDPFGGENFSKNWLKIIFSLIEVLKILQKIQNAVSENLAFFEKFVSEKCNKKYKL